MTENITDNNLFTKYPRPDIFEKKQKMAEKNFYDEKRIYLLYKKMDERLGHHRYIHSVGVAGTAVSLAMKYGEDIYKAQIAGILHDCAKCYSDEELVKLCRKNDLEITEFEEKHGYMLHGKYGAYMARYKYDIDDEDIINAIRWHTTGRENMSVLEKIIYISDYIEPSRNKASNLDSIREEAFNGNDINKVLVLIMQNTINYLKESENSIDNTTLKAFDHYLKIKQTI